ncbi:undecaprenyl-diphosphate phosphatase [Chlamydiota bacterium]
MHNNIVFILFQSFIQGIAEFLPISSSGHLVVLEKWFNYRGPLIEFNLILHLGTVVAIIIFFRKRIITIAISIKKTFSKVSLSDEERMYAHFPLWILASLVGTGGVYLSCKTMLLLSYEKTLFVGCAFLCNALILFFTKYFDSTSAKKHITLFGAFLIGIAQGIAIIPGVSRSGITIAVALILGFHAVSAFEYTFILSIPTICIASIVRIHGLSSLGFQEGLFFIVGFISSCCVGLVALWILKKVVLSHKLYFFSFYCFVLGVIVIISSILK